MTPPSKVAKPHSELHYSLGTGDLSGFLWLLTQASLLTALFLLKTLGLEKSSEPRQSSLPNEKQIQLPNETTRTRKPEDNKMVPKTLTVNDAKADLNTGEVNLVIEDEIVRESRARSEFYLKLRDPREFVKIKSDHEITPALVKGLLNADVSLPVLYSLLEDPVYEKYWPRIVKTICFVSKDPKSVPVILEYVRRSDDWQSLSAFDISVRCMGKIDSLRWIGLIGGEEADKTLMQALTPDGVKDLAGEWLGGPLPIWAKTPQEDIIDACVKSQRKPDKSPVPSE